MQFTFTLPEGLPDMTVKELLEDYFLLPRKTRHLLRSQKQVWVNGRSINWQSPVSAGDEVFLLLDSDLYPAKNIPQGQAALAPVLYQDEHLIIVNKPEGMKTHANEPQELALLNHAAAAAGTACYVVHRLDKETSGAVLFAKNPFVLPILNRLLEKKEIQREYWALIEGDFQPKQQTYREPIGRDRHDRRKRRVDWKSGRSAETQITRLKSFGARTLVRCRLKTGRTHQIRVHLAHHGYPIVGDPLYNPRQSGRLMLHAHRLTLLHPFTLKTISVEAASESFEKNLR